MDDSLQSIADVKIPYASEGVIRTAQLDDTVSPTNSVQLAVNMNFDRVGAIQTRPGVTQYADDLVSAINNFGTLRNAILPPGYVNLFQMGSTEDLQRTMKFVSAVKVSDTKVAIFYADADNHGWAQNLKIDESNGDIIPIGTPLEFDSSFNSNNKAIMLPNGFAVNVWTSTGNDGLIESFNVSADTIVGNGSLDFDTSNATWFSLAPVDADHVMLFYSSTVSGDGVAVVFEINASTGATTQPGSALTYQAGPTQDIAAAALGDGVHFAAMWEGTSGFVIQSFSLNTGTFAITAIGSQTTVSTVGSQGTLMPVGDMEHFVGVFRGPTIGRVQAQAFDMDPITFAMSLVGTDVLVSSGNGNDLTAVSFGDGQHFISFFSDTSGNGFVQMIAMDPVTFDMSVVGPLLSGFDFSSQGFTAAVDLTTNKVIVIWGTLGGDDGKAAMLESLGDVVEGRWLYAGYVDTDGRVANLPAGSMTWTDRRTGLNITNKPRFAQFLNYEWMVNGNNQLGGDPVATSNGGDFGTDLVPAGFPKGDFISAGFEGRVWVADKTLGIIYYTDIVQFIPPNVYTLTYNAAVNFIEQLTPNTGETITALQIVPRALLVFTENSIYRIYGASSMDAYPAYNVGTFSQESIVTTKTGIFFHHSSGFYQFDYGSAPVEISRRIIDFVKAIPRGNYDEITGVYDGFDNVEWSVGQVVVEGVVFSGCVVRYTISTQVWTIYDYKGIDITANIFYDDGTNLNHLMGTSTGKTGQMDVGETDFGNAFYYEFIDRWRSFTDMYYKTKRIDAVNVYNDNAAGANLLYQTQDQGPNAWMSVGPVDESTNSIIPNGNTQDFDVIRLRLVGTTKGPVIVVHGLEILQLTNKGQKKN